LALDKDEMAQLDYRLATIIQVIITGPPTCT